ncbi:MAG: UDP-N-acetylmuramate--L-alanine ligase [bacterium]
MELKEFKKVFFTGIGGVGISATARILNFQGIKVSGSEVTTSELTEQLIREGVSVVIPQKAENVPIDAGLLVYSVAVPEDNPERQVAKKYGIKEITYPQLLGLLMKDQYGIGVSGTNGKTTTTALLSLLFLEAEKDPTVVLGGKTDYLGGNSRVGSSQYFIFESDEYRRAFVNYFPKMAVVTYVTEDHLDYYKDINDIKAAFRDYLVKVPADGFIFANADDANSLEVAGGAQARKITFGMDNQADIMAKNIRVANGQQIFDLSFMDKKLGEMQLHLPAKYNIYNVLAAVGPALMVGLDFKVIQKAVAKFKGSWRRFEKIGQFMGIDVISDYAHTPDAVEKTILAAQEFYPGKKVLTIFQPHQYNRTKNFFEQFALAFKGADQAFVMDIFFVKGRENPADFDVSSEKLAVEAVKLGGRVAYLNKLNKETLSQLLKADNYGLILTMGAGDIYNYAKELVK